MAYKRIFGRCLCDMKGSVQMNTARYLPYLVVYLRDYPENPYLALGDIGLQKFHVWSQSVYNKVQFTWKTQHFLCSISFPIQGIFL